MSEDFETRKDEEPREPAPNPTQQRIDEDKRRREQGGWEETADEPHEGEEGQDIV